MRKLLQSFNYFKLLRMLPFSFLWWRIFFFVNRLLQRYKEKTKKNKYNKTNTYFFNSFQVTGFIFKYWHYYRRKFPFFSPLRFVRTAPITRKKKTPKKQPPLLFYNSFFLIDKRPNWEVQNMIRVSQLTIADCLHLQSPIKYIDVFFFLFLFPADDPKRKKKNNSPKTIKKSNNQIIYCFYSLLCSFVFWFVAFIRLLLTHAYQRVWLFAHAQVAFANVVVNCFIL